MADMVKSLRAQYPKVPIGVEAYIEDLSDIAGFREAGATELKLNIETWPESRFRKLCPKRHFRKTLEAMEEAVRLFGRGKVTANIIVGLGESDAEVVECLGTLSRMGVIPNLRGIRIGPLNRDKLERALGRVPEKVPAERLLSLGKEHRRILEENGLDTGTFRTMCFSCRCCDLVPMADL
jgi:biotin synthase-related radical SAM superfamily protein